MIRNIVTGLALGAVLATAAAVPAGAAGQEKTWEGLERVRSKQLDEAYLLPGADFRGYDKVIVDPIQVSFYRNWERDMNQPARTAMPRVSPADVERIRKDLADGFQEVLVRDLKKAGYQVVSAPGPDVLRLTPMLVNVYVNAPDTTQAGRVYSFTLEAGEATMALEVRDSDTNQLLGRAVDRRRTGETGMWTWTTRVSNRVEFGRIFGIWSSIIVDGLKSLKEASPVQAVPLKH